MTDIVERLRDADISGHGSYSALVREAADEIERLNERVADLQAKWGYTESIQTVEIERLRENAHYAKGTIERLETENEQWRKLNSQRVDEIAGLIHRLRDRPRDDGTVVAVSGEPGASAGKSE